MGKNPISMECQTSVSPAWPFDDDGVCVLSSYSDHLLEPRGKCRTIRLNVSNLIYFSQTIHYFTHLGYQKYCYLPETPMFALINASLYFMMRNRREVL